MLKKWLASVGIGSAKVDTQLDSERLIPGESVKGKVLIEGGKAEQQIDRINLFIMTEALRERDDKKYYQKVELGRFSLSESFTILEGEKKELDFEFTLPIQTPPTLGRTKVWIQTGLDIPSALDPKDRDYIEVSPHAYVDTILGAITNILGFQLRQVEMEYSNRYGYLQEFEFTPSREFRSDLDELEVFFFVKEESVELLLQVDRRAKGLGGLFAEALDMDERYVRLSFAKSEIDMGANYIASQLNDTIRKFS
ncbi:sporulation protein [Aquibacillus kalidii]|uniref:sporulation protein n=1 Tax=Aquibacillus kalidii TaxID=2762597 RepID=UPI00164910F8|nr:sporulation protein [Aquibacillus kalidii]